MDAKQAINNVKKAENRRMPKLQTAFYYLLEKKTGLTSTIVAKFAKSERVSGETIKKLCLYFKCQPSDIYEVVEDKAD